MIDVRLAADLFAALPSGTRLVLVGDVDQLPSVGPGAVLADVIASGRLPVVRLTEIFRQAARSLIVTNAHRIHDGLLPELGAAPAAGAGADQRDFFFLEEGDAARAAEVVRDLVTTRLPRRYDLSPHDVQVLAPMHRGELGAGNLNLLLQEALTAGAPEIRRGSRSFRVGDRVMQLRNNYDKDVFNGDIGRIERLDSDSGELVVRIDDREIVLRRRRAGRAGAGLRGDRAQVPGLRVPGGGHSRPHPALRDAAAKSAVHRGHPGQATGGAGRHEKSAGPGRPQRRRRPARHPPRATVCARRRRRSPRRSQPVGAGQGLRRCDAGVQPAFGFADGSAQGQAAGQADGDGGGQGAAGAAWIFALDARSGELGVALLMHQENPPGRRAGGRP